METIRTGPHALPIPPEEIARLAGCGESPRWRPEIDVAIAEARDLVAPRAIWRAIDAAALGGLFAEGTPVEPIARRGECWVFAATIGEALENRVKDHFEAGRYLQGLLLDAAGSVAADAVADLVERSCAREGPSARFSPGYCMWRLDNQRALLALLDTAAIGLRLLPSLLMHPLKSVSGIVVRGRAMEDLEVPAEECSQCDATGCARRGAIG